LSFILRSRVILYKLKNREEFKGSLKKSRKRGKNFKGGGEFFWPSPPPKGEGSFFSKLKNGRI